MRADHHGTASAASCAGHNRSPATLALGRHRGTTLPFCLRQPPSLRGILRQVAGMSTAFVRGDSSSHGERWRLVGAGRRIGCVDVRRVGRGTAAGWQDEKVSMIDAGGVSVRARRWVKGGREVGAAVWAAGQRVESLWWLTGEGRGGAQCVMVGARGRGAPFTGSVIVSGMWVWPASYHGGCDRLYSSTGNAGRPNPPRWRSSQVPLRLAACPKLEVLGLIEIERMHSSMPGLTAAL